MFQTTVPPCRWWMGISGLLPALKTTRKTRHPSEFRGQTIAVDAYVFLRDGISYRKASTQVCVIFFLFHLVSSYPDMSTMLCIVWGCFGILLSNRRVLSSTVDLCLLRGGQNLNAEGREENLSHGKALAAQAKHPQAWECFVKRIDVTPQMAYQYIKVWFPSLSGRLTTDPSPVS